MRTFGTTPAPGTTGASWRSAGDPFAALDRGRARLVGGADEPRTRGERREGRPLARGRGLPPRAGGRGRGAARPATGCGRARPRLDRSRTGGGAPAGSGRPGRPRPRSTGRG